LREDVKSEWMPIFLIFLVCCDYLICTDSYFHVGVCAGNRSYRHDANSRKIGRHNRMSPTCRDDISDMSVTDKNVCRLRGVADRHICRHCQPRMPRASCMHSISSLLFVFLLCDDGGCKISAGNIQCVCPHLTNRCICAFDLN
jgi:hypothetical protein